MFHELAHGTVANWLGDPTARLAGRLTLNPLKHLEVVGSFIVPLICIISQTGFIIGWAKPVPFNPRLLRNQRWGPAMVASAGPLINIFFALVGSLVLHIPGLITSPSLGYSIASIVVVNIALAVFNLVPIPPLDGHHIVGSLFPRYQRFANSVMEKYGIILIIVVLMVAGSVISPVISFFINLALPGV